MIELPLPVVFFTFKDEDRLSKFEKNREPYYTGETFFNPEVQGYPEIVRCRDCRKSLCSFCKMMGVLLNHEIIMKFDLVIIQSCALVYLNYPIIVPSDSEAQVFFSAPDELRQAEIYRNIEIILTGSLHSTLNILVDLYKWIKKNRHVSENLAGIFDLCVNSTMKANIDTKFRLSWGAYVCKGNNNNMVSSTSHYALECGHIFKLSLPPSLSPSSKMLCPMGCSTLNRSNITKLFPNDSDECSICLTREYESDHVPVALPCGHIFGMSCMLRCEENTCPICRTDHKGVLIKLLRGIFSCDVEFEIMEQEPVRVAFKFETKDKLIRFEEARRKYCNPKDIGLEKEHYKCSKCPLLRQMRSRCPLCQMKSKLWSRDEFKHLPYEDIRDCALIYLNYPTIVPSDFPFVSAPDQLHQDEINRKVYPFVNKSYTHAQLLLMELRFFVFRNKNNKTRLDKLLNAIKLKIEL